MQITPTVDLVSIFGLLEPHPVKPPDPAVQKTYTLDSFAVAIHGETALLTCRCRRSEPYRVAVEDLSRIHPASGLYACSRCLNELREARTPSDKIAVWFNQNRPFVTKDQHLYLPESFQRLVDRGKNVIMRPRRFVYSKFFGVTLTQKDKVLQTCTDPHCVNPLHMMVCASAATKLTPDMKKDVELWLLQNIKPQVVRQLLEIKYSRSLSLRTITNLRKSMPA